MSKVQSRFKAGDTLSFIWREELIRPAVAKLFVLRTSNLPASKEDGQGDCPPPADATTEDV